MNFNPFILATAFLQWGGTWYYLWNGQIAMGILYLLYGFTNILGNLNDEDLNVGSIDNKFKGNQSMITFTAIITF